jgi:hypothetical protein
MHNKEQTSPFPQVQGSRTKILAGLFLSKNLYDAPLFQNLAPRNLNSTSGFRNQQ